MSIADVGRTRFVDGMRVAREHLDHLQDMLLQAGAHSRNSAGLGKVCFGLQVQIADAGAVSIGPGVAFDRAARVLAIAEPQPFTPQWGAANRLHLVVVHALRAEGVIDGVATLLFDEVGIEARLASPPYDDDAVVFAELSRGAEGAVAVTQRGEWYLPPSDHTHSGRFVSQDGLWRYDGQPLGLPAPRYDSGFLAVAPGARIELAHGLGTTDLLVQLLARTAEGGVTTAGLGSAYWFELDAARITLARADGDGGAIASQLRVTAWPLDPAVAGPLLPLADPGPDLTVEPGAPFVLDGSRSRGFGGHTLTTFIWTKTT